MIVNGSAVSFNDEKFIVIYVYDTGYCEIREQKGTKVELVHISELVLTER